MSGISSSKATVAVHIALLYSFKSLIVRYLFYYNPHIDGLKLLHAKVKIIFQNLCYSHTFCKYSPIVNAFWSIKVREATREGRPSRQLLTLTAHQGTEQSPLLGRVRAPRSLPLVLFRTELSITGNDSFRVPILSPYIEGVHFRTSPSMRPYFRASSLYDTLFYGIIFPFVKGDAISPYPCSLHAGDDLWQGV